MIEDLLDYVWVSDVGDDSHGAATQWTQANIKIKDSFEALSPIQGSDQFICRIGLAVSNITDMGDFLHEVLELDPANIEADIHRYDLGQTQIQLWEVSKTMPKWVGRPHEILGMTMVQFIVNDVYAARETIVERGGTIHLEPYVLGDLGVVMFAEGPDGILFEFAASLVK